MSTNQIDALLSVSITQLNIEVILQIYNHMYWKAVSIPGLKLAVTVQPHSHV